MRKCKKCENEVPHRININGTIKNLKSRTLCFKCSPFKSKNLSIGDIDGDKICACKSCGRVFTYSRHVGHSKDICCSCRTKKRRLEIKKKCVELLGGKCQECGYDKCINALELHHKNPKEKDFSINDGYIRSWDIIKKEVLKCKLLCANCHREEHYKVSLGGDLIADQTPGDQSTSSFINGSKQF